MTREHYDGLLAQLDHSVGEMGELVLATMTACIAALQNRDTEEATRLIDADNLIDQKRHEIESRSLLLIATQQPLAGDLRAVAAILTIATELERIGDYLEGIAKLTLRIATEPVLNPFEEIRHMAESTHDLLAAALTAFRERNLVEAERVWAQDDEIDQQYERIFRELLNAMIVDRNTVRRGTYLLWVAHNLERIADRATNIVERLAFLITGDVATFRDHALSQTPPR